MPDTERRAFRPADLLRSLRSRAAWVWRQDSAWADATAALALLIWTAIDLAAAPGVTERPAFGVFAWIPDGCITAFTACVTVMQVTSLLMRSLPGRVVASFFQGLFWATISLTLLGAPTGNVPLTISGVMALTVVSWISLARTTRRYSSGG